MASGVESKGEEPTAKEKTLVKKAIALFDTFCNGRQCLDDFIKDASEDLENMDPEHKMFILDIISGCSEYKSVLDAVIDVFYDQNYTWISRGDRSQFVIICYLATFALDEIGFEFFTNIVKSLDVRKMYTFMNFFLTNLTTWIQDEWNKIYDASYVEKNWIGPLLRWRPDIEVLVNQLSVGMTCASQLKKPAVRTTKPQEFAITRPKPRPLPMPEEIPVMEKTKPVPQSTYRPPKEMEILEELKQKNHQRSEELLEETRQRQLRLANSEKSERTMQLMSQIKEDIDSKYKFQFHSSKPPRSTEIPTYPIKLNSAAKLRQVALRNHQEQKELQRIKDLIEGGHEPSSFLHWQEKMREKMLQEEMDKSERKHLEGYVSHDRAAVARIRMMERNHKAVQTIKEGKASLMRRYADKRMTEEKGIRVLMQHVAEGRKNSKDAKDKLMRFKQSIVREVSGESKKLLRQALEDSQAEMNKKFQLIREISIMESLPHLRANFYDDTETGGHKLLGEMSVAELKVRLSKIKATEQSKVQDKRKTIQEKRDAKKRLQLEQTEQLESFSLQQKASAIAAAIKKEEERAKKAKLKEQVMQSDRNVALRKQHEELSQERQRQKEMEKSKAGPTSKYPTKGRPPEFL
ncbi:cilia- and flagella-associated protein 99 isoform X2 [Cynoglossus semilaevis]|uniref:cilia- and flagella-associated protein 99 isoform X2 n=1 Tax=Cynoglossus semilaevis TaxID=244447 RepID=UPI0007DCB421|nr:cilia- and flagella-associated protein 99 isoform X2 [Cynoglossus semilaevis]